MFYSCHCNAFHTIVYWAMLLYNKNPCEWVLWDWSSRGQLTLWNPRGRRPSGFQSVNWPSEDQSQRTHSKWVFVFIPQVQQNNSKNTLLFTNIGTGFNYFLLGQRVNARSLNVTTHWLLAAQGYHERTMWCGLVQNTRKMRRNWSQSHGCFYDFHMDHRTVTDI